MRSALNWLTKILTTQCTSCHIGRVSHSHSEPHGWTTIEVYKCNRCNTEDWSGSHEAELHGGVICAVRGGEVICLNGYHIMKDAYEKPELIGGVLAKKTESGLLIAVMHEEQEKNKRFEIMFAPADSELKAGDVVVTRPHCDIKLEGDFNYPMLPQGTYYVRKDDLLGKVL